ncbi:MBL fold metallo-hydrolase [Pengzhenrongella sicca]|uniref:MBL fold metallo-hydrolase n=1 Tax=Pengzhenrongella sicca TaxID=2819238 RepID=A0A8A4Z9Z2_9MICO|nr:MBL fold metallo-hydrolase [Pengzhenrongella sicca]QTE27849.1 MBL fold metallo-hydrolase [Pengzhenrongella sicca]
MDLTRLGHACVRLDSDDARLVLDPGAYSLPGATDGADAVLVTHEHPDHVVVADLRAALVADPALEAWAPAAVVAALLDGAPALSARVHEAHPGDAFEVAGFAVEVFGELHAVVHPDVPRIANVAYLVSAEGRSVLHPGDSLTVVPRAVDVLLVPVAGPWLLLADAIDYVRAVAPAVAVPIHDAVCSPAGVTLIDRLLGPAGVGLGVARYRRPADGEPVAL